MNNRWNPTVLGYRGAALAARAIPFGRSQALAPLISKAFSRSKQPRAMLARHLARVDPTLAGGDLAAAVDAAFASYARYWIESFRLPHQSSQDVDRGMVVEGYEEHILPALQLGRGVILALPHLGGWEWGGRWLVDRGHRITVVVERLEPAALFDWFVDLRSSLGMHVVPLDSSAGKEVLAALGRNEIVCLLSDRQIGAGGVEVEFFGERTQIPGGPATIALRAQAPVLPTAVYFSELPDGHFALVRPPLDTQRRQPRMRADVARITQLLATELEVLIRRAPSQWHLLQPNWPSDPGYPSRDHHREHHEPSTEAAAAPSNTTVNAGTTGTTGTEPVLP